jgi:hypothetical protein
VKSIRENAFSGCTALEEVILPDTLTAIRDHAFENCTGLKKIVIPPGVKEIGPRAFAGCSALADVELPPGVNVAPDAFEETPYQQTAERSGASRHE